MIKFLALDKLPSYRTVTATASLLAPIVNRGLLPRPFLLTYVVTHRCNGHCRMCNMWQEKSPASLSLDQVKNIFARDDFSFVRQLVLTGGEPTLRPDLPELFETISASGPNIEHVELATNGLNTKRVLEHVEAMLEIIERSHNKINRFVVQVSLDGVGNVHDEIRGVPGFYQNVRETLEGLQELEQRYQIISRRLSCVVLPNNLEHIPELRELARQQGMVVFFSPAIISDEYYQNVDDSEGLSLSFNQEESRKARELFRLLAEQDSSAMGFYYDDVGRMIEGSRRGRTCMMGFYGCIVEHDGQVFPCVNYEKNSFGNLLDQSFDEIWFSPRAEAARKELRRRGCPLCFSSCFTSPVGGREVAKLLARRLLG